MLKGECIIAPPSAQEPIGFAQIVLELRLRKMRVSSELENTRDSLRAGRVKRE